MIDRTDDKHSELNSNQLKTNKINGHPHLEWLLQRNKEKQFGGDEVRLSYIEGLLDEPLLESGKKSSKPRSFVEELLSEPLFENGLAKAVIKSHQNAQELLNIPVSPSLTLMKSTHKLPDIFYPPPTDQFLKSEQDRDDFLDLVVEGLEFVKQTEDKREKTENKSDRTSHDDDDDSITFEDQMRDVTNGNKFDILQSIPGIEELVDDSHHKGNKFGLLTTDNVLDFNNRNSFKGSIRVTENNKVLLERKNTPVPQTSIRNKKFPVKAPNPTSATYTIFRRDKKPKQSTLKKKIIHHLVYILPLTKSKNLNRDDQISTRKLSISTKRNKDFRRKKVYLFPSKLTVTSEHHHKGKQNSNRKFSNTDKSYVMNKHVPESEKTSSTYKNIFLPSHFENYPSSIDFQDGSFLSSHHANSFSYGPEMKRFITDSYDGHSLFPYVQARHLLKSLHHRKLNAY
ncbi:uncharacterized protein LOC133183475 [Saccostrea echinata]|uniref:uncharacterized protein LOC133183475 n=1 Tax=Saccostrea echinata TaxID=191078 RepID=UPI002A8277E1|nr:uncharacterized protein LOC133183475 [Saccostrea echinata]